VYLVLVLQGEFKKAEIPCGRYLIRKKIMKKNTIFMLAGLSLLSVSMPCLADSFYIDAKNPNANSHVFHDTTGSYIVTAEANCNGMSGGRICITIGEGTDCNIESPPGIPNVFRVSNHEGPTETIIIRASRNNPDGIACGTVQHGNSKVSKLIHV
jgi:hypothetical protein